MTTYRKAEDIHKDNIKQESYESEYQSFVVESKLVNTKNEGILDIVLTDKKLPIMFGTPNIVEMIEFERWFNKE